MKKRCISWLMVLCMVVSLLPSTVWAAETVGSGACGENLSWELDSEGTLTIRGSGKMAILTSKGENQ